jgi:hypothetical protein
MCDPLLEINCFSYRLLILTDLGFGRFVLLRVHGCLGDVEQLQRFLTMCIGRLYVVKI